MIITCKCDYCGTEVGIETEAGEQMCPSCGLKLSTPKNPVRYATAGHSKPSGNLPRCPYCQSELSGRKDAMQRYEVAVLISLFLLGIIPAVIYGLYVDSRPFCANCDRRV
jgi:DNA-directed RNA polymerase subunit RPC12/RpoP